MRTRSSGLSSAALSLAFLAAAFLAPPDGLAAQPPAEPVTLWPVYQQQVLCPCEYVGFSFDGPWRELQEMRRAGAEICGLSGIWIPTRDPAAPGGYGVQAPIYGRQSVSQYFTLAEHFSALGIVFATEFQTGSATVALYRAVSGGGQGARTPHHIVATRRFEDVPDGFLAKLDFPAQEPGRYYVVIDRPTGQIGVWLTPTLTLPGAELLIEDTPQPGEYLEFAHFTPEGKMVWHSDPEHHRYQRLAYPRQADNTAQSGLKLMMWVGNWNNGGFPYYPDWFYEAFPDMTMVDAGGKPILAGMFDAQKGWPSIDHPAIVDGTSRYIRAIVEQNLDVESLIYWTLGGEALYPTYLRLGEGWADYSPNAQAHFRAWLERKYHTAGALNEAWGTSLAGFAQAEAPVEGSLSRHFADWLDYRFAAMAERMSWHYAAVRSVDPRRLTVTANHGNIFWGDAYPALGADLPQFADASDGFEMGQIMDGDDPGYFNLWWASALAGLGKVGAPARLAYKFPDPRARGGGRSYTPAAARRYCLESLGSGWWHLGLIQWSGSLPDGEWGVRGTPGEREITRVFADLKRLRPLAEGAWPVLPRLGLYLSRYTWQLKGWDPAWTTLHTWAIQHQYDHAILWEQQAAAGEAEQYPVVIAAHDDLVDPPALRGLERYVRRGGHLVLLGDFALRDGAGQPVPPAARAFLQGERVHHLPEDVWEALEQLPGLLDSLGARPFCRLEPLGTVAWDLSLEPLSGLHDRPESLAPRRTLGQSFAVPGERVTRVAFRTPTYVTQPRGFSVTLRLRRDGPDGEVLAEGRVPAEDITDNAWTGVAVDVPVPPRARLYAEIVPDRELGDQKLGVWADTTGTYGAGAAYVDGREQPWDFEFLVGYEVRMPASMVVEAFTLFDGANFLLPLVNLAGEEAGVRLGLDPGLLTADPADYAVFDALSGRKLAPGVGAEVTLPPTGYRVLWVRQSPDAARVAAGIERLARRLPAGPVDGGKEGSFHQTCLARARQALDRGRPEKALGYLNRAGAHPVVAAQRCTLTDAGDLAVRLTAGWPDGTPFTEAVGVLRAVPLPDVLADLREVRPGSYEGRIPAEALVAYDYAARRYVTYEGPLQAVGNLWRGRSLAQLTQWVR